MEENGRVVSMVMDVIKMERTLTDLTLLAQGQGTMLGDKLVV